VKRQDNYVTNGSPQSVLTGPPPVEPVRSYLRKHGKVNRSPPANKALQAKANSKRGKRLVRVLWEGDFMLQTSIKKGQRTERHLATRAVENFSKEKRVRELGERNGSGTTQID